MLESVLHSIFHCSTQSSLHRIAHRSSQSSAHCFSHRSLQSSVESSHQSSSESSVQSSLQSSFHGFLESSSKGMPPGDPYMRTFRPATGINLMRIGKLDPMFRLRYFLSSFLLPAVSRGLGFWPLPFGFCLRSALWPLASAFARSAVLAYGLWLLPLDLSIVLPRSRSLYPSISLSLSYPLLVSDF